MATRIDVSKIREVEDLFVPALQNCKKLSQLKKIHADIVKYSLSQSSFLVTKMVDVCDKHGDIEYATLLFKQVIEPNVFLYNALIRGYTHNYRYSLAISSYRQMLRYPEAKNSILPDRFTFPFVIKACAGLTHQTLGKQIHGHVWKVGPKNHVVIENALIDMYTKCDNLLDAHQVFEELSERDAISWNCLISGYVRLGQMRKARSMFDKMPYKTIVSWTAMITGYTQIGCYADSLELFRQMQMVGIEPDEISVMAVLPACAHLGALELGNWIHKYSATNGLVKKTGVCNALIEMYAKCGCIDQATQLFDHMGEDERDVISWSTIIAGLANHGKAHQAIETFQQMQRARVEPNGITFLGLLIACSHAGLWREGLMYFDRMVKDHHIGIEHYGCLVDMVGRAGQLTRALDIVEKMPMKPDSKIWGSLLSCCRSHWNLEIAIIAMEHLIELEPDDTGNFVLLSNIYAHLGIWEGVSRMRKLIRSKSTKRNPGCSLIEVNNVVQEFVSCDDSKPFSEDIFHMLKLLTLHPKGANDIAEGPSKYLC